MIKYNVNEDYEWESAEIIKRAAKASGKNCHWWNITNLSGNEQSLNLQQIIYDFEIQQNMRHKSFHWKIFQQILKHHKAKTKYKKHSLKRTNTIF